MRIACTSRRHRPAALVVLVVALVAFGASAASAAPPPPPVPPNHRPPITPNFALHPDHGPVGTQVTIQGICGKPTPELLYAVQVKSATGFQGFQTIWIPPGGFAHPSPTPFGTFHVTFTFPAAGNVVSTGPLGPGTYYIAAACNGPGSVKSMGRQPFTVTPSD